MVLHSFPVLRIKGRRSVTQVGRQAQRSRFANLEKLASERKKRLEGIKLMGHRYLKPPGIHKTLKAMHEEESFFREASQASEGSMGHSDPAENESRHLEARGSEFEPVEVSVDYETGSESNDLGPMNASLPSLFYT